MFSRHRDAVVAQHRLEEVLVHAERRAEHARADVGHACELEQALHRPVLAERPVQHREDDVDVGERRRDLLAGQRARPRRSSRTSRRSRAASAPERSICTRRRRCRSRSSASITLAADATRDRVLARAAAEDHGDAPRHGGVVVVVVVVVVVAAGRARLQLADVDDHDLARLRVGVRAGSWLITIPSWLGSVTGSVT